MKRANSPIKLWYFIIAAIGIALLVIALVTLQGNRAQSDMSAQINSNETTDTVTVQDTNIPDETTSTETSQNNSVPSETIGTDTSQNNNIGTDDYYGFVESRPSDTAGTWVVSGRSFTTTDNTRLDPDDGPLTVGRCVSVDYEGDQALEIESEPDSDCSSTQVPANDPPASDSSDSNVPPSNTGDDDYYGFIESWPSDTAGTWVISGRSFTATDNTRLDPDDGPLSVGRCVSVDYEGDQALEIESEPDSDCSSTQVPANDPPASDSSDSNASPPHTGDDDYYGFIESRPSGTAGTWVVSGRSFTTTDNTRLDPDDGPLTVGRCVSVDYESDQALEIESEPDSDC